MGNYTFLQGPAQIESLTTQATAGGTTALFAGYNTNQEFTGTLNETVDLPDATTLKVGRRFNIFNASTGTVTVRDDGGTTIVTLATTEATSVVLSDNGTSDGVWAVFRAGSGGGGGSGSAPVVMSALFGTSTAISANVPIVFDEVEFDSDNAYDDTTGEYTIPSNGYYWIGASFFTATAPGGFYILKNGSDIGYLSGFDNSPSIPYAGSALVFCTAGDTIAIASDSAVTLAGTTGEIDVRFQISKSAGLSSSATIAARASQDTTASITALNPISFDTVDFDTLTTMVAGVFTAPVAGNYQVSGMLQLDTPCDILLYKNGSLAQYLGFVHFANENCPYGTLINLAAGDTIDVRPGATTNVNGISGTPVSYFGASLIGAAAPGAEVTMTNWAAYTPTTAGLGTITGAGFFWRRVSDTIEIKGSFVCGTVTATTALVSLPSGLNADPAKLTTVADGALVGSHATDTALAGSRTVLCDATGLPGQLRFGYSDLTLAGLNARDATDVFATGASVSFYASLPIVEWA